MIYIISKHPVIQKIIDYLECVQIDVRGAGCGIEAGWN